MSTINKTKEIAEERTTTVTLTREALINSLEERYGHYGKLDEIEFIINDNRLREVRLTFR